MSKKFPYGYKVDKYIEKAVEEMKYTYPWAKKELFDKRYEYRIEKVNNRYQYAYIYHWQDSSDEKKVLDMDGEEFSIFDDPYYINFPVIKEYPEI